MRLKTIAMVPFFVCIYGAAHAAVLDRIEARIQQELAQYHVPGLAVAISRGGQVVFMKGYGLANVELSVPVTPDTVFQLASVTKQFTAAGVLLLVHDGKLTLDTRVGSVLPELPRAWRDLTVRQLLSHTSGLPSYTDLPDLQKRWRNDMSHADILALIADQPLKFRPGEREDYSNTNYFLLGMVIEKVSGRRWDEFLAERIFRPLGMRATRANDQLSIVPHRAAGYRFVGGKIANAECTSMTWPFAAGALLSTVSDLTRWDAALYDDRLLPQPLLQTMWTPVRLNDGRQADYGFGWRIVRADGRRLVYHSGGIPGFLTNISRFIDDRLTVIVLSNSEHSDPQQLARDLAAIYLGGR